MKYSQTQAKKDRGAIIILFLLLLVALFSIIALTIDTTLVTSSHSHLKTSGDAAVLGALEEYASRLSQSPPPSASFALGKAIEKAELSLGHNFTNNPGKFLQKQSTNTQDILGTDCSTTIPGNGCLRPILWYSPMPVGPECSDDPTTPPWELPLDDPNWRPQDCTCDKSCECGEGCPNDPFLSNTPGTGLKLMYKTDNASPLKALFGALIGIVNGSPIPEIGLTVTSTALLTPRNAMFLLDLSDSMASLARPSGGNPASYYDIQSGLTADPTTSECFRHSYAYQLLNPNTVDPMSIANKGPRTPLAGSNKTDPRNNFYNCLENNVNYELLSDANPGYTSVAAEFEGGPTRQDAFFINKNVDPEPLTSALDAVNQAMNSFSSQRVPNDRLGVIGFDDERINNRILALNKNDEANIQPAPLGDPEFIAFEEATRVVTGLHPRIPITDPKRYSKYLFPRYLDKLNAPGKVGSDLPAAFKLAREMIKHTLNYRQSQNFAVMFSDGMTNCLKPIDPNPYNPANPRCKSDQGHFTNSLALLREELVHYSEEKIAVHFLLLGSKSQPHRVAWKSNAGSGCATVDEIEGMKIGSDNLPVVNIEAGYNANGSALVNQIYPWVAATGGMWAPILDSFGANPAGACTFINQADFDAACNALPPNTTLLSDLKGSGAIVAKGASSGGGEKWPNSIFWDKRGRILCDPQNRTTAQQVQDVMKVLLGKPPFVLVQPNN